MSFSSHLAGTASRTVLTPSEPSGCFACVSMWPASLARLCRNHFPISELPSADFLPTVQLQRRKWLLIHKEHKHKCQNWCYVFWSFFTDCSHYLTCVVVYCCQVIRVMQTGYFLGASLLEKIVAGSFSRNPVKTQLTHQMSSPCQFNSCQRSSLWEFTIWSSQLEA